MSGTGDLDYDCECDVWAENYTSTTCPDEPDREAVVWTGGGGGGIAPMQQSVRCCKWTFTQCSSRSSRGSSGGDECGKYHEACASGVLTTKSNCDATSMCITDGETRLVGIIVGASVGGICFILCVVGCCLFVFCQRKGRRSRFQPNGQPAQQPVPYNPNPVAQPVQGYPTSQPTQPQP